MKGRSMNVKQRGFFGAGFLLFGFTFMAAFLAASHFAPITDGSASSGISVVNDVTGYYASITSSGEVEIDLTSSPQGSYEVGSDTLTIDTNAKEGYKLYISTASASASNGLINEKDSTEAIPASTAAASRLAANTWGFAPARATSGATAATYDTEDADPTNGAEVWMGVPEYGNEAIFYTNTTPTTASTNSLDVYYAVNASTAFSSGIYSNTVIYTAIADGGTDETGESEASISPVSQDGLAAGTEVTIATGLYPGFSVDNLGTITVTIGGQSCTSVTPVLSEIGSLNVTCEAPAQTNYGSYTVMVTVAKYGKTYTLTNAYEYVKPAPAFYTITRMQEMTHAICADSQVITPNADATTTLTKDNWDSLTDGSGIPTTTLLDDRAGQKSYTVKKLADGKCWMTENLALPAGAVLNASNSDLDGTVVSSYTIPASTTPFTNVDPTKNDSEQMYDPVAGGGTTTTDLGYKVGNYYSWRTATAGTGRGAGSNPGTGVLTDAFGTDMTVQNNNTLVSICPKGWRLPTSGNNATTGTTGITTPGSTTNLVNGDFTALYQAYGGAGASGTDTTMHAQMTNPSYGPNFARSGRVGIGGQTYVNTNGYFCSSTVYSYSFVYNVRVGASFVYSQDRDSKYGGFSVRCLAR